MKKKKPVKKQRRAGDVRAPGQDAKASGDPTEEWYRPRKKPVTLRLDADVIAWLKSGGRGYQTRINRELRRLMMAGKGKR